MRRGLARLLVVVMVLWPSGLAWSVGSCGTFRSWNTGDTVTAADFNSSFTTAATTNTTWPCLGGYSQSTSQMQTTADLHGRYGEPRHEWGRRAGQLRFVIQRLSGWSQWYTWNDPVLDLTTGSGIQGLGSGGT